MRRAVQGLLGPKEGAVLRIMEPGVAAAQAVWRILYLLGGKFVQVCVR